MGDDDGCVYSLTKVPLSSFLFIVREIWSGSILELYFENGFVLQFKEWTSGWRVIEEQAHSVSLLPFVIILILIRPSW